jgi:hypothetical protein
VNRLMTTVDRQHGNPKWMLPHHSNHPYAFCGDGIAVSVPYHSGYEQRVHNHQGSHRARYGCRRSRTMRASRSQGALGGGGTIRSFRVLCEMKHDGFRALPHIDSHHCELRLRNSHTFKALAELCEELAHAVKAHDGIIDGEIVCLDRRGRSNFKEPAVPARLAVL